MLKLLLKTALLIGQLFAEFLWDWFLHSSLNQIHISYPKFTSIRAKWEGLCLKKIANNPPTTTIIHYHHQQPSTSNNNLLKIKFLCPDNIIHRNILYQHRHSCHSPPHHHPHQLKRTNSHCPRPSHHRNRCRKLIIIVVIVIQSSTLSYTNLSRGSVPILYDPKTLPPTTLKTRLEYQTNKDVTNVNIQTWRLFPKPLH